MVLKIGNGTQKASVLKKQRKKERKGRMHEESNLHFKKKKLKKQSFLAAVRLWRRRD